MTNLAFTFTIHIRPQSEAGLKKNMARTLEFNVMFLLCC